MDFLVSLLPQTFYYFVWILMTFCGSGVIKFHNLTGNLWGDPLPPKKPVLESRFFMDFHGFYRFSRISMKAWVPSTYGGSCGPSRNLGSSPRRPSCNGFHGLRWYQGTGVVNLEDHAAPKESFARIHVFHRFSWISTSIRIQTFHRLSLDSCILIDLSTGAFNPWGALLALCPSSQK